MAEEWTAFKASGQSKSSSSSTSPPAEGVFYCGFCNPISSHSRCGSPVASANSVDLQVPVPVGHWQRPQASESSCSLRNWAFVGSLLPPIFDISVGLLLHSGGRTDGVGRSSFASENVNNRSTGSPPTHTAGRREETYRTADRPRWISLSPNSKMTRA